MNGDLLMELSKRRPQIIVGSLVAVALLVVTVLVVTWESASEDVNRTTTPNSPVGSIAPGGSSEVTPTPTPAPSASAPAASAEPPAPPPDVGVGGCAPWPATPDASCTGYRHTGVTLKSCNTRITAPGTYDSCLFTGGLVIASTGVIVTRSLVDGGHVEGGSPGSGDLRGAIFEDFQILGPGNDGAAAIGTNNYTCRRCDVSGNNRGFSVANRVLIIDSYAHDFWIQPESQQGANSTHQTAISTHGGSGVQVIHSTLRCNSDRYACSSGFSFYSEDAPGISDVVVRNCLITTDAGYGMMFASLTSGKPYGITNVRVTDNVISSSEYGPVANFPTSQAGNVWSGNRAPNGSAIGPG
jgi:hypothetical protein